MLPSSDGIWWPASICSGASFPHAEKKHTQYIQHTKKSLDTASLSRHSNESVYNIDVTKFCI